MGGCCGVSLSPTVASSLDASGCRAACPGLCSRVRSTSSPLRHHHATDVSPRPAVPCAGGGGEGQVWQRGRQLRATAMPPSRCTGWEAAGGEPQLPACCVQRAAHPCATPYRPVPCHAARLGRARASARIITLFISGISLPPPFFPGHSCAGPCGSLAEHKQV